MSVKEKKEAVGKITPMAVLRQEDRDRLCSVLVEANTFEQECLWEKWNKEFEWKQIQSSLYLQDIGCIGKRSKDRVVGAMVDYAVVDGILIGFYYSVSRFVDHDMVERVVRKQHKKAKLSGDAGSFYLVAADLRDKRK